MATQVLVSSLINLVAVMFYTVSLCVLFSQSIKRIEETNSFYANVDECPEKECEAFAQSFHDLKQRRELEFVLAA